MLPVLKSLFARALVLALIFGEKDPDPLEARTDADEVLVKVLYWEFRSVLWGLQISSPRDRWESYEHHPGWFLGWTWRWLRTYGDAPALDWVDYLPPPEVVRWGVSLQDGVL